MSEDNGKEQVGAIVKTRKLALQTTSSNLIQRAIQDIGRLDEKEAIEHIKLDCELHYKHQNKIMFSSKVDFYKWMEEEVRCHAKLLKLDFQKAKEAYISWAIGDHPEDYDQLK